jgi:hypothetical protein
MATRVTCIDVATQFAGVTGNDTVNHLGCLWRFLQST